MADNLDSYTPLGEILDAADQQLTRWEPPGPMSLQYIQSEKPVRIMIGPIGSGKTTTMLVGEAFCAIRAPRCLDGVRRYSFMVTRDSYRQLYKTAIPSWQDYFPPTIGQWDGGQDRPAEHKLKFLDQYGPVELTAMFAAIPDGSIRDWLDGFQVTSIVMNAANSHPRDVYDFGGTRINRYPAKRLLPEGVQNEAHMGGDMNKTDVDEWVYEEFVLNHDPATMTILDFPSGLDPAAENRHNLPATYYEDNLRRLKSKPWLADILVHNKWGASREGLPVFTEWDDAKHMASAELAADAGLDLCIGLDGGTETGGRPAAVFFQVVAPYQVRVIDELYLGRCGPNRFFNALLARLDEAHLRPAASRLRVWGDPSMFYGGGEDEDDELTWLEIGENKLNVEFEEPESNELEGFRLETLRVLIIGFEGGQWMLKLSPRCRMLRKGFNAGYRYKMRDRRGVVTEEPKPEKNDSSHPMDALQHGVTGFFGRSLITNVGRARRPTGGIVRPGQGIIQPDFDVFG